MCARLAGKDGERRLGSTACFGTASSCMAAGTAPTNNCSPHTCSAQWPCRAAAHSEKSVPNVMVSGARPAFFISS